MGPAEQGRTPTPSPLSHGDGRCSAAFKWEKGLDYNSHLPPASSSNGDDGKCRLTHGLFGLQLPSPFSQEDERSCCPAGLQAVAGDNGTHSTRHFPHPLPKPGKETGMMGDVFQGRERIGLQLPSTPARNIRPWAGHEGRCYPAGLQSMAGDDGTCSTRYLPPSKLEQRGRWEMYSNIRGGRGWITTPISPARKCG